MKRRVACNANIWRCLGANGATSTRRECALRVAGWPAQGARRGIESPPHAGLQQASRRLEGCQAARGRLGQRFFWCLLRGQVDCSQHRQQRIGPHGQGDMPIPACPTAHLIVIQTNLALRLFKAPCNGPAAARHRYDRFQGGRLWRKHDVGGQCCRVTQTPADQQPAAPGGLPRRG
jgi:hypothetical protein